MATVGSKTHSRGEIVFDFRKRRTSLHGELEHVGQGLSQPHHHRGWAKFPLSFFLQFRSIFPTFPQTFLIFFLTLALRVGESPTREGPGYATVLICFNFITLTFNAELHIIPLNLNCLLIWQWTLVTPIMCGIVLLCIIACLLSFTHFSSVL